MSRNHLGKKTMQVFYMAREPSACPLIPEIVKTCRTIGTIPSLTNSITMIMSMRYGKRLLITGELRKPTDLTSNDFLEIVDVDPVKQIAIVIGVLPPPEHTPLHWLLQQARRDINVTLQCKDIKPPSNLLGSLPRIESLDSLEYLDLAKTILPALQGHNTILINSQEMLTIHKSLADVEQTLRSLFG